LNIDLCFITLIRNSGPYHDLTSLGWGVLKFGNSEAKVFI